MTLARGRHLSRQQLVLVSGGILGAFLLACNLASQPGSPPPAPPTTTVTATEAPPTTVPCPFEDETLCVFIAKIEPAIESGDIDTILNNALVLGCGSHGSAGPGFDPARDCGQDEFCAHFGALQGEGGCTPVSRIRAAWEEIAVAPIRVRGIAYPAIPGLGLESVELLNGPAILISTGDDEWDWILIAEEESGGWQISALLLQRRQAAKYQTPEEMVIPWP